MVGYRMEHNKSTMPLHWQFCTLKLDGISLLLYCHYNLLKFQNSDRQEIKVAIQHFELKLQYDESLNCVSSAWRMKIINSPQYSINMSDGKRCPSNSLSLSNTMKYMHIKNINGCFNGAKMWKMDHRFPHFRPWCIKKWIITWVRPGIASIMAFQQSHLHSDTLGLSKLMETVHVTYHP